MSDTYSRPREENGNGETAYEKCRKMAPVILPIIAVLLVITTSLAIYFGISTSKSASTQNFAAEQTELNEKETKDEKLHPRAFVKQDTIIDNSTINHDTESETSIYRLLTHVMFKNAMNYTNAADSCSKTYLNGRLAFPRTLEEEEIMMASFIDYYEKEKEKLYLCRNHFFLGLRKILDEEWLGADGKLAAFGPPISMLKHNRHHDFANEHCAQVLMSDARTYHINNINCKSHVWNCFVCQYPHRDPRVRSFEDALLFCQFLKKSGTLAVIPHLSILEAITEQMKLKECKNAGIGHKFSRRYESFTEERLPYKTNRIYYRPGGRAHITYSCIVINAANHFKWEVESCTKAHCYVCFSDT